MATDRRAPNIRKQAVFIPHWPLAALFFMSQLLPVSAYALEQLSGPVKFPDLIVTNNGSDYTGIEGLGFHWTVNFHADMGTSANLIREWGIKPMLEREDVKLPLGSVAKLYKAKDGWPNSVGPKEVTSQLVEMHQVKEFAMSACKDWAKVLKDQNKSDADIYGREQKLGFDVKFLFHVRTTQEAGFYDPFWQTGLKVRRLIICKPWSSAKVPTGSQALEAETGRNVPGPGSFTATPPFLDLEIKARNTVMIDGQICPRSIHQIAIINARKALTGNIVFFGDAYLGRIIPIQVATGQTKRVRATRELKWVESVPAAIGSTFGSKVPGNEERGLRANVSDLRSQNIWVAYNILDEDKKVKYQFERKRFTLTCRSPQVSQALPASPGNLQIGTNISEAKLSAKPNTPLNSQICKLDYKLQIKANVANAKIPVEFRSNGRKLGSVLVETNAQKEGWYSGSFSSQQLAPGGVSAPSPQAAFSQKTDDAIRGVLQAVGTGAPFESNQVSYNFRCKSGPGAIAQATRQAVPQVPVMDKLTVDKQPQKLKYELQNTKITSYNVHGSGLDDAETPDKGPAKFKTSRRSANEDDKTKLDARKFAKMQPLVKEPRIDFSVDSVQLTDMRNGSAKLVMTIGNNGDDMGRTPYEIKVRDDMGNELLSVDSRARLRKGQVRQIVKQFSVKFASRDRSTRITARAETKHKKDQNAGNNWKQTSATIARPRMRTR